MLIYSPVLLLDEATSALDTKSEGVVQEALEAAGEGRTVISIAHRLSTIRDAFNIVVMSEGRIVEQGNHTELLEKKGAYYNLVSAQNISKVMETKRMTVREEAEIIQFRSFVNELFGGEDILGKDSVVDPDDDLATLRKSVSSMVIQKQSKERAKRYSLMSLIKLIASFNKEEWILMVTGLFACVLCGAGNPVSGIFFAKQVTNLSQRITPENAHHIKHTSDFWSLMFLMLALVTFITMTLQGVLFARCSERLIRRVRDRAFRTMLRQDISYFDQDENTSGALTSFLSTETTQVAGISGATLGTIVAVSTTLVVAIATSIAIGWKLALVCTATMPVLLACGFLRFWMLAQFQSRSKAAYQKSASYASEAISAIRTVAALTREEDVLTHYHDSLAAQQKNSLTSVLKSSTLFAASQSVLFLCFAVGFYYGGKLIGSGEYTLFQFFATYMMVVFGGQSAGTIFSSAPDQGKAHDAARELKRLFENRPNIDTWSNEGERVDYLEGDVEFRDVHFRYPTRPGQPVLRGLNLTIRPGQYVALVGASGCGKSTTISLLERFYDPLTGGIFVDGKEISTLNVNDYRGQIALVSQEPTLYQGTIRDNIVLGTQNEYVSDEAIENACREANIYDFILSLPEGFDTVVGSKGALLSGGQKQRIAIARALIRDPRILLLDEATSALDSESEKVVQAALDRAAKGRTTIAVAHRLSSIQGADVIYVFDQGKIVEAGTHKALMSQNGRYAELVNLQSLEKAG
jgi:ATP-binding cassette subfamily B (MDR/TAP) protein 1